MALYVPENVAEIPVPTPYSELLTPVMPALASLVMELLLGLYSAFVPTKPPVPAVIVDAPCAVIFPLDVIVPALTSRLPLVMVKPVPAVIVVVAPHAPVCV